MSGAVRQPRADSLRVEAEYLPRDVDELADLRRQVIAAGYAPSVANGLVGWLVSKAAGEPDVSGAPTRARYRKILAELDQPAPPAPDPNGGRRRARRAAVSRARSTEPGRAVDRPLRSVLAA